MRKKYVVGFLVVLTTITGSATAFAVIIERSPDVVPISYARVGTSQPPPIPPVQTLQEALRGVTSNVFSARIGEAPAGAGWEGKPWLYASVRVPKMADGLDVEPMWEADLVEGVVVERSGTSHDVHDNFGGSTFDAVLPDGTTIPNEDGGLGDVVRGQKFSTASDNVVKSAMMSSLRDLSLTPVLVSVLRPWGAAPAVVASTADPGAALKQLVPIERTLFGNPPMYEGYYLELRDGDGNTLVRASSSFRTGVGRLWIDPKWAGASAVVTSGPPVQNQP